MVDPVNSTLGKMLLDEITPAVMVLRTPLVEEACQKNGLSFVEMLSPFCNFSNIDVPVRTASDQTYRLRKFKLRLFYASDVRQPNVQVAKERLREVITRAGEKDSSDLYSDPPQIETLLATSQEFVPSWFQFFNEELVRSVSFSEHEAFDHPVACILAVSSKDEDPIRRIADLFNTNQLPSLLNDGAMDPKILKHFIVVHDNQDGTSEKATKILTEMRNTFGSSDCRMLYINSSTDEIVQNQDNPWAYYQRDSSQKKLACFLSIEDEHELKNTLQDLSSKYIIPHMEQKIRLLNQEVSATRKGFRNQIKNLWWRKGKDETPDNPSGQTYTFSSIEYQIRVLGDYAFMLRDYELALSNYRLLSTDYKLDKAWKHYAGVQEMMGLTYFMLDQSRKDAEYCMENAFTTYLKIGLPGQQNATRCGLWWVEMLKARDQYKEAANVYFRISGEEPLHSAVMLEQASYCYLFSSPPMMRKYGFQLVLAGDLYQKCDQIKHAIRMYRAALSVFKGTTWSHIRDHVNFHIGKWYAILGMFDVSVKHMLEVLACGHQSKMKQELFLKEFFQIVQKTGKTFEVCKLQLPVIDIASVKVVFEDTRTYGTPSAVNVKQTLWNSLEEDMIPSLVSAKSNWLELQSKILPKKYKESNVCVAGEAIKVDFAFKNPLQIAVSMSSASLICEHSLNSDTESETSKSSDENLKDPPFMVSEADVLLKGGETLVVQLTVTPKVEGTLKIVGVRWKLSGSVTGFCNFETDLTKKKGPKGRRKSNKSTNNLNFLVIKSLPKVEGIIRDLPKTVYVGDLRHLALELRNPSEISVKNLKIKVTSPRFLNIGNQEMSNIDFPACLEKRDDKAQTNVSTETKISSNPVFSLPQETVINGETPLLWPLWLRAATPGRISLYVIIYYEVGDVSSVMRYRTLRMHYNLEVLPSLDVRFHISSRPSKFQEFLVRMDVLNKTDSENFEVHQVSSVGNQWEISLLQPIDNVSPMEFIRADQELSCFFKLKNCRKLVSDEETNLPEKANVRLGNEKSGGLFDISNSPLIDFHQYERAHQGVSDQENQSTVDFILISRAKNDENPGLTNSKIFSHHTCHCSLSSTSPIWWKMDGPQTIKHDFTNGMCEIPLKMTIHNSSDTPVSIQVDTLDPNVITTSNNKNEAGWRDLSLANELKVTTETPGTGLRIGKSNSIPPDCVSPYIWSGSTSNRLKLDPLSSTEIRLQICVFSPGTYDLSNYSLHWNLIYPSDQVDDTAPLRPSSGTSRGHSYYLTVLQVE